MLAAKSTKTSHITLFTSKRTLPANLRLQDRDQEALVLAVSLSKRSQSKEEVRANKINPGDEVWSSSQTEIDFRRQNPGQGFANYIFSYGAKVGNKKDLSSFDITVNYIKALEEFKSKRTAVLSLPESLFECDPKEFGFETMVSIGHEGTDLRSGENMPWLKFALILVDTDIQDREDRLDHFNNVILSYLDIN